MKPDDNRHISIPSRPAPSGGSNKPDRDLAVALMREQIDRLYEDNGTTAVVDQPEVEVLPAVKTDPEPTSSDTENKSAQNIDHNPYDRTHDDNAVHPVQNDQWQRYHTAWQQYYQQYYERYYLAQIHERERKSSMFPHTTQHPEAITETQAPTTTPNEASSLIKSELRQKIKKSAQKVRKSRHFVPALSAIMVMIVFLFLQYNRLVLAQVKSYVSPGAINPQNIILDAGINIKVGPEPRMIIPKINVDAPVVYGVQSLAEATVQNALRDGIVHYPVPGANANPGEKGNSVFLGHSSNDVFDDGKYKFVFVQLEQMVAGDKFYINYNGTRYTYTVTRTEVILPTEVSKLLTDNSKPTVTLVSCTPVGTAQKRFLVHADQTSPDPNGASTSTQAPSSGQQPSNISGNSPTLFDRLFGF